MHTLPPCDMLLQQHEWTKTSCVRPPSLLQSPGDIISPYIHGCVCFLPPPQPLVFLSAFLSVCLGKWNSRLPGNIEKATFRISARASVASRPKLPQLALLRLPDYVIRLPDSEESSIHPVSTTLSGQWRASLHTKISCSELFSLAFQMLPCCSQSPRSLTICLAVLTVNVFLKTKSVSIVCFLY